MDLKVDVMDLIKINPLLQSLTQSEISGFLKDQSFRAVMYGKNQIVHFVGDACARMEIVLSGKVAVERIDEDGNLMTVADFFADDILGGNLLFSKNPHYPMTITAKQPALILEIEKELLFKLFSDNHVLLRRYLEFVSDRAAFLGDKIKHYVNRTIRESIMSFLDYESKEQNSKKIVLTITKKSLAEKIGVQRTSLSRELTKMKEDGLILYDSTSITICYSSETS